MPNNHDRPTMQDIADHVGVSKALVSLVFRNAPGPSAETRKRVLAAADELGYRVNRAAALMTARRSHLIGVMANIRSTFHAELVEDIVAEADRYGYEVVLGAVTPTHAEPAVVETLLSFRCEALILLGPEIGDASVTEFADGHRLSSSVVVCPAARRRRTDRGRTRHRTGSSTTSSSWATANQPSQRWHRHDPGGSQIGLLRAMKRHGLGCDRRPRRGLHRARRDTRRTDVVGPKKRPTAVCAANDRSAIGLLDELRRSGVDVPGVSRWPATTTACWPSSHTST